MPLGHRTVSYPSAGLMPCKTRHHHHDHHHGHQNRHPTLYGPHTTLPFWNPLDQARLMNMTLALHKDLSQTASREKRLQVRQDRLDSDAKDLAITQRLTALETAAHHSTTSTFPFGTPTAHPVSLGPAGPHCQYPCPHYHGHHNIMPSAPPPPVALPKSWTATQEFYPPLVYHQGWVPGPGDPGSAAAAALREEREGCRCIRARRRRSCARACARRCKGAAAATAAAGCACGSGGACGACGGGDDGHGRRGSESAFELDSLASCSEASELGPEGKRAVLDYLLGMRRR